MPVRAGVLARTRGGAYGARMARCGRRALCASHMACTSFFIAESFAAACACDLPRAFAPLLGGESFPAAAASSFTRGFARVLAREPFGVSSASGDPEARLGVTPVSLGTGERRARPSVLPPFVALPTGATADASVDDFAWGVAGT